MKLNYYHALILSYTFPYSTNSLLLSHSIYGVQRESSSLRGDYVHVCVAVCVRLDACDSQYFLSMVMFCRAIHYSRTRRFSQTRPSQQWTENEPKKTGFVINISYLYRYLMLVSATSSAHTVSFIHLFQYRRPHAIQRQHNLETLLGSLLCFYSSLRIVIRQRRSKRDEKESNHKKKLSSFWVGNLNRIISRCDEAKKRQNN